MNGEERRKQEKGTQMEEQNKLLFIYGEKNNKVLKLGGNSCINIKIYVFRYVVNAGNQTKIAEIIVFICLLK